MVWPNDISADGTVVAGLLHHPPIGIYEAFRWTAETGFVGLGDLGGEGPNSGASGISADGAVIVGNSRSPSSGKWTEAMRWTEADGMVGLGDLPGGCPENVAYAASANGSVLVGRSSSAAAPNTLGETFRWTAETGTRAVRNGPSLLGFSS